MERTTFETLKVYFLDEAPVSLIAPTLVEIQAGVDLTPEIPVNGVNKGGSSNNAATPMMNDAFVTEDPGTYTRSLDVTFVKDRWDVSSVAWDLFTYRTEGYFVFCSLGTGPDGAAADGDPVEVWHVKTHEKMELASAENEHQKFSVTAAVQEKPTYTAVVGGESS